MRHLAPIALCSLVALAAPARAQVQAEYRPGAVLGIGYESLVDSLRGSCVEFESSPQDNPGAQVQDYVVREVTDDSQLSEVLGLSASASYSALFGTAEGKAKFAKNVKVSQYSNTFAVRMSVRNSANTIVRPRLRSEMAALAKKSLHDFRLRCGNLFIQSIQTGGELNGFVRVETSDLSMQRTISASFKLDSAKLDVEATADAELKRALKYARKEAKIFQAGGSSEAALTVEELVAKVRGFAEAVAKQPVTYAVYLADYRTVDGFPSDSDLSASDRALENMLSKAWELNSVKEDVKVVQAKPEQFHKGRESLPRLVGLVGTINQQMLQLQTAVEACRAGKECKEPPLPDVSEVRSKLPLRYLAKCSPISLKALASQKLELFSDDEPDTSQPWPNKGFTIPADKHVRGDKDMKGNNPKIFLNVELVVPQSSQDMKLELRANVRMEESKKDWTTFSGSRSAVVHQLLGTSGDTAPGLEEENLAHCRYDPVQPAQVMTGRLEANGGKDEHNPRIYRGGQGLVASARCRSDSKGNDLGYLYCDSIRLNDTFLRLKHVEDNETAGAISAKVIGELSRQRAASKRSVPKVLPLTR